MCPERLEVGSTPSRSEEPTACLRPLPNVFLLVSDRIDGSQDIVACLKTAALVRVLRPEALQDDAQSYSRVFVDINLTDVSKVRQVRRKLESPSLRDLPRVFFVNDSGHHTTTQAQALGATSVLARSAPVATLLQPIREDAARRFQDDLKDKADEVHVGVSAAHRVVAKIFEGIQKSRGPTFQDVVTYEADIARALHHANLQGWLEIVRHHHNHSYRHCLMVTGFSVAFGSHLGLAVGDNIRLARAALMHDVGKAFTPIAILDKPGKLTNEETTIIRRHPRDGYSYLLEQGGFPEEVLDTALHHHEMLDGTGYPDRLAATAICDMVQMITIADIYSALVEDRPYRAAMSHQRAFGILTEMGSKLDRALVREFGRMRHKT